MKKLGTESNEINTCLKRMAVYYLLMAINIIPSIGIITDNFPTRNLVSIFLFVLSVGLVLYYAHRMPPTGELSAMMKSLSWLGLLLILLRAVKYSAFAEVGVLARHTWYVYYVPIMLLPLFLFYISLLVSPREKKRVSKSWYAILAVTLIFILLILTNDLHQQVFGFKENFENWDNDYSHGILWYVLLVWQFALYFAAIIILVVKCRIGSSQKGAWIILIPVAIGVVLYILLLNENILRIDGNTILEFPEVHFFTTAVGLECCMQLGLIPTNAEYGNVFRNLSISAQISDRKGRVAYLSSSAVPLTKEQFLSESGSRIGEHAVLNKMEIPGGYGFWQDDMTELDSLNEELEEAKEGLAQEAELSRLKNELKEKQAMIKQRTLVYDAIAGRTQKQSQAISRFAEAAHKSTDPKVKDEYRRRITLAAAYIKRYANLMLLSEESEFIEVGELGLSVSEVLRYLNYCGVPCEFIGGAERNIKATAALAVFEAFESLLEQDFYSLRGVFVNLSAKEDVVFKTIFENVSLKTGDEVQAHLSAQRIKADVKCEDNVTYVCFTIPKGGAAL